MVSRARTATPWPPAQSKGGKAAMAATGRASIRPAASAKGTSSLASGAVWASIQGSAFSSETGSEAEGAMDAWALSECVEGKEVHHAAGLKPGHGLGQLHQPVGFHQRGQDARPLPGEFDRRQGTV